MGTYYIPRDTKGEGRILYIFSTKGLVYTVVGVLLGFCVKWLLNLIGGALGGKNITSLIGNILIGLFAIIGFVIGTFKVPALEKFEVTKKAAGFDIDMVLKEYIKFHFKKDKYYVYDVKDLVKEQLEKEENEKLEEERRKEKA